MGTLPAIVKAIALNNKLMESREFASLLQSRDGPAAPNAVSRCQRSWA